ncbi:hypothetical protein [Spirillospora sp. CA-294931]
MLLGAVGPLRRRRKH